MKFLEKYIARLVRWAFKSRVRVFYVQSFIPEHYLIREDDLKGYTKHLKAKMAYQMAEKLEEEGLIQFTEREDHMRFGRIIRAQLYALKLK